MIRIAVFIDWLYTVILTQKSSARGSLTDDKNISYSTALGRIVIVPLVFRNCNIWNVLKTCLDFKFVTYNNCETGAAGPYTAFARFVWTFLPSDLLFLNYTKDKFPTLLFVFLLFLYYVYQFWLLISRRNISKTILRCQADEGLKPHIGKLKVTYNEILNS
jgi:hypothetical protein